MYRSEALSNDDSPETREIKVFGSPHRRDDHRVLLSGHGPVHATEWRARRNNIL